MRRPHLHRALSIAVLGLMFLGLMDGQSNAFMVEQGREEPADGRPVIVIDPGHGGEDSGAKGPGGTDEKKIALEIAKRLATELRGRSDCRVLLTRLDDTFVPLRERTGYANAVNAELFISIHANAAATKDVTGIETYFLSFEATDDEARRLAAVENGFKPSGKDAGDADTEGDLQEILSDLTLTLSHHESSTLAESVQASMVIALDKEDRGVKQAPFIVLAGAAMPSVLIEVGFITNPADEKRMSQAKDQIKIARAIADGVAGFKKILARTNDKTEYKKTVQKTGWKGR